ncbi:hypothetical protein CXB51_012768 [Gossypium anomalum]|uniref:Uncharacterized protein n=1 Tax=Gossypium anomalum TaxID=47600 RepID=A0A8J5ZG19_9ROSI|nr:hypothetical protein CXB51_012768 [Gossypium anomalum]
MAHTSDPAIRISHVEIARMSKLICHALLLVDLLACARGDRRIQRKEKLGKKKSTKRKKGKRTPRILAIHLPRRRSILRISMAAPPARARADYDYLIKLLLIGDSGVGKSCLLLRFSDGSFTTSFITTIGCWFLLMPNFSLQSFQQLTIVEPWASCWSMMSRMNPPSTRASLLADIRNWIRNIEQHASDNVNKILVGNKADMDESKRAVPTSKGQALADEYGIKFFETSAKTNLNVEEVFFSIARDIKQRLVDTDSKAEPSTIKINKPDQAAGAGRAAQRPACCGST